MLFQLKCVLEFITRVRIRGSHQKIVVCDIGCYSPKRDSPNARVPFGDVSSVDMSALVIVVVQSACSDHSLCLSRHGFVRSAFCFMCFLGAPSHRVQCIPMKMATSFVVGFRNLFTLFVAIDFGFGCIFHGWMTCDVPNSGVWGFDPQ